MHAGSHDQDKTRQDTTTNLQLILNISASWVWLTCSPLYKYMSSAADKAQIQELEATCEFKKQRTCKLWRNHRAHFWNETNNSSPYCLGAVVLCTHIKSCERGQLISNTFSFLLVCVVIRHDLSHHPFFFCLIFGIYLRHERFGNIVKRKPPHLTSIFDISKLMR